MAKLSKFSCELKDAMRKSWILIGLVLAGGCYYSCTHVELAAPKETYLDLPATPYTYINNGLDSNNNVPTLGRVLFYDLQLSLNNSISCASCHKQAYGFTDNVRFSRGFENRLTSRNSMPIQNLSLFPHFIGLGGKSVSSVAPSHVLFWDGRETDLKRMVLKPVFNHVEMGIPDPGLLANKLNQLPYYKDLFVKAFGPGEIMPDNISEALKQFVASISSVNTRLDKKNRNETKFTPQEAFGEQLFITKYNCNRCHQVQEPDGYLFAGTFSNIGLDPVYADNGLGLTTKRDADNGKFKIPSLRNIAVTAPYMHDGRFKTLSDVIDHYKESISNHPNLDQRLRDKNMQPLRMGISDYEKQSIIAFLKTLTDDSMASDPKFSNPFKFK